MCYILECDFFVAECCGQQRIQKIKETHSSFKEFGKLMRTQFNACTYTSSKLL